MACAKNFHETRDLAIGRAQSSRCFQTSLGTGGRMSTEVDYHVADLHLRAGAQPGGLCWSTVRTASKGRAFYVRGEEEPSTSGTASAPQDVSPSKHLLHSTTSRSCMLPLYAPAIDT